MKNYFVYRYFNKDNELIYVGLTDVSPYTRLKKRENGEVNWFDEINRIECIEFKNSKEMVFCEYYLIAKLKPKYNIKDTQYDIDYSIDYFDNLEWRKWDKEEYIKQKKMEASNRQTQINLEIWADEEYKKKRIKNMFRKAYTLIMPNEEEIHFESRKNLEQYFSDSFGMSRKIPIRLIETKEPYKTHYRKYKYLEGMKIVEG